MSDLEITRACAEAMGGKVEHDLPRGNMSAGWIRLDGRVYDPLHDDAQCFALVERFGPSIGVNGFSRDWSVHIKIGRKTYWAKNENLNFAICEAVAKMHRGEA